MATPNNPNRLRILFVDDERSLQEFMRTELPRLGHDVVVCPNGTTALQAIAQQNFDFAILDIRMPDMTGIDVLQRLKQISPDTDAVMMTGYASEESMVQAMRLGACDYLRKPCKMSEIEAVLLRAADKKRLKSKAAALEARVHAAEGPSLLVGSSPAMQPVLRLIEQLGPTDARVLITGETATGKEVVAKSLFLKSKRVDLPFVPVNCGTLNQNLAESELFGHKKGSHSTADRDRKGLFEVAHTGTLFLDELGDLDKNIQVKLLRFLESGEVRPLGATEAIYSDVRVIAATNKDLTKMIAAGEFREDLLYRLNMFHIHLPPLRDRKQDIPDLAVHLLALVSKRPLEMVVDLLTDQALEVLMAYNWKGNIRELKNAMEYAWIVSGNQPITAQHLPMEVRARLAAAPSYAPTIARQAEAPAVLSMPTNFNPQANGMKTLADVEMEYILAIYAQNNFNKQSTSNELGISLKTLYNKLHKYEEERRTRAG